MNLYAIAAPEVRFNVTHHTGLPFVYLDALSEMAFATFQEPREVVLPTNLTVSPNVVVTRTSKAVGTIVEHGAWPSRYASLFSFPDLEPLEGSQYSYSLVVVDMGRDETDDNEDNDDDDDDGGGITVVVVEEGPVRVGQIPLPERPLSG